MKADAPAKQLFLKKPLRGTAVEEGKGTLGMRRARKGAGEWK
jgi:hypothetical protein